MDPAKLKAALDALIAGDADACAEILKALIADAASGGAVEAPPPPEATDALSETAEAPPEEKEALAQLRKLTGKESAGELVVVIQSAFGRLAKIDADARTGAEALELSSRRELVGELVKLGVEFPSTAWEGKPEDRQPVKRLAAEPLAELRARVELHKANKPGGLKPPAKPASVEAGGREVKTSRGVVTLSAREVKNCESLGANVETYAENKIIRDQASRKGAK